MHIYYSISNLIKHMLVYYKRIIIQLREIHAALAAAHVMHARALTHTHTHFYVYC